MSVTPSHPATAGLPPLTILPSADGRLELFARGPDEHVYDSWQIPFFYLITWSDWASLGKPQGVNLNDTQVAQLMSGRLIVLSVGDDGALWAIQQTPARNAWESWFSFGKPSITFFRSTSLFRGLTSAKDKNGYLSIFAVGDDGAVWKLDQLRTTYLPLTLGPNYY